MRSTLEARWANFFTDLGLLWTYEPKFVAGYTPDFAVNQIGYVEIKPTLELFIRESSHKVKRSAAKHPQDFYAFIASRISFEVVALYRGETIFTPTWRQMTDIFQKASGLDADYIARSIIRANQYKMDHFVSVGKVLEFERPMGIRPSIS